MRYPAVTASRTMRLAPEWSSPSWWATVPRFREEAGPFASVRVNTDLTFDFDDRHGVQPGHYAFLVDDDTFDAVLDRLRRDGAIDYGSGPQHGWDRQINHLGGGRGVYVRDPDGHSYELFTAVP
jgi:catechol 2,3-dioxygenase-like lactoylglutathione lyase family enzyme